MDSPEKKPKSLIPKKAQIPLLLLGIPLFIFTAVRFASQMGWIGGVPKAKRITQKTEASETKPKPAPAAAQPGERVASLPQRAPGEGAELESIQLPDRDPLAEISRPPQEPLPKESAPSPASSQPSSAPPSPPPLPPPMGAPASTEAFPSPVVGETAALPPEMSGVRTARPKLPEALTITYPMATPGGRLAEAPPIALVGTISGSNGALAVVRSRDIENAPGQYVRPGQTVGRRGPTVKAIGSGKVTLSDRGRTHELSLPPGRSTTRKRASPRAEAERIAAPTPETGEKSPAPEPSAAQPANKPTPEPTGGPAPIE